MSLPWYGSVMQARKAFLPYLMKSAAVADAETSGMLSFTDAWATAMDGRGGHVADDGDDAVLDHLVVDVGLGGVALLVLGVEVDLLLVDAALVLLSCFT
jgi:hypothetical protein